MLSEDEPLLTTSSLSPDVVINLPPVKPVSLHLSFLEYFMVFVGCLGSIGMGFMPLAFYYFFGQLIGEVETSGGSIQNQKELIQTTAYYFGAIAVVAGISSFFQQSMFLFVGEQYACRIRRACFASVTRQDISYFDQTETGYLVARLSEDAQLIRDAYSEKMGQLVVSVAQFCGGVGYAFYLSWQMTVAMMLTAPFMAVALGFSGAMSVKYTKATSEASASALSVAEEVISSMRTVRSFSQEDREVRRFSTKLSALISVTNIRSLVQGVGMGLLQLCVWASCGISFWVGGWLVGKNNGFTFADVITVFGMMLFGVLGISVGLSTLPQFLKAWTAYKNIRQIIDRQPTIRGGTRIIPDVIGKVEFENVSFCYSTREVNALSLVSFKVNTSETVAIVGESGSGKSSVFSLLERFYDPIGGVIRIDGVDIRELDLGWLHSVMTMVSQEPVLFGTTIAENISYANEHASMDAIIAAAKTANAHDFILDLPQQYQTQVGERGVQLSGGQKQRIAIARAVLCNPKILLLDEATSALDTQSERLVQEALDRIMVGKTSLVIAHRLATIQHATRILVMSNSQIVESGTHQQLLENQNGVYHALAKRQLLSAKEMVAEMH